MEPIINPWFFYFLHIAEMFQGVSIGLFVIFSCAVFGAGIWFFIKKDMDEFYDKEKEYKASRRIIKLAVVDIILIIFMIFIPSRKTLISMYVAKHITTDNVQKALTVGKDFKEEIKKDIFELINGITKEKEKKGGDS